MSQEPKGLSAALLTGVQEELAKIKQGFTILKETRSRPISIYESLECFPGISMGICIDKDSDGDGGVHMDPERNSALGKRHGEGRLEYNEFGQTLGTVADGSDVIGYTFAGLYEIPVTCNRDTLGSKKIANPEITILNPGSDRPIIIASCIDLAFSFESRSTYVATDNRPLTVSKGQVITLANVCNNAQATIDSVPDQYRDRVTQAVKDVLVIPLEIARRTIDANLADYQ